MKNEMVEKVREIIENFPIDQWGKYRDRQNPDNLAQSIVDYLKENYEIKKVPKM